MKVKNDHRSKFSNLSNWKEEVGRSLFVTQCFCSILRGKGRTISILMLKAWNHMEHTIFLSRKRVNKGKKRINSLPLSPVVISYATLQGKPLLYIY